MSSMSSLHRLPCKIHYTGKAKDSSILDENVLDDYLDEKGWQFSSSFRGYSLSGIKISSGLDYNFSFIETQSPSSCTLKKVKLIDISSDHSSSNESDIENDPLSNESLPKLTTLRSYNDIIHWEWDPPSDLASRVSQSYTDTLDYLQFMKLFHDA